MSHYFSANSCNRY